RDQVLRSPTTVTITTRQPACTAWSSNPPTPISQSSAWAPNARMVLGNCFSSRNCTLSPGLALSIGSIVFGFEVPQPHPNMSFKAALLMQYQIDNDLIRKLDPPKAAFIRAHFLHGIAQSNSFHS